MAAAGAQPENSLNADQWVDRHGDTLFRYALSRLRDSEAAEEVVQETLVAHHHPERLGPDESAAEARVSAKARQRIKAALRNEEE